VKVTVIPENIK